MESWISSGSGIFVHARERSVVAGKSSLNHHAPILSDQDPNRQTPGSVTTFITPSIPESWSSIRMKTNYLSSFSTSSFDISGSSQTFRPSVAVEVAHWMCDEEKCHEVEDLTISFPDVHDRGIRCCKLLKNRYGDRRWFGEALIFENARTCSKCKCSRVAHALFPSHNRIYQNQTSLALARLPNISTSAIVTATSQKATGQLQSPWDLGPWSVANYLPHEVQEGIYDPRKNRLYYLDKMRQKNDDKKCSYEGLNLIVVRNGDEVSRWRKWISRT